MARRIQYRVWFTVESIDGSQFPPRTTFVVYEGVDRRHALRLARDLGRTHITNRVPHTKMVESGWEVAA